MFQGCQHLVRIPFPTHIVPFLSIDISATNQLNDFYNHTIIHQEERIVISSFFHFWDFLQQVIYLLNYTTNSFSITSLESLRQDSHVRFYHLCVCWGIFVARRSIYSLVILDDHTRQEVIRLNLVLMVTQIIIHHRINAIDRLQHIIDGVGSEETGTSHVFLATSSVHTGMLQYGIHLELLRVSAIEETQHVIYGDTTIQDITTNKDISRTFQSQLSLVIQQG